MHPPSRREGDGVNLWAATHGLALGGCVQEGVDRVLESARRRGAGERVRSSTKGLDAHTERTAMSRMA